MLEYVFIVRGTMLGDDAFHDGMVGCIRRCVVVGLIILRYALYTQFVVSVPDIYLEVVVPVCGIAAKLAQAILM